MDLKTCKYCETPLTHPRAKICGSKPCKSKRVLDHVRNLAPIRKVCKACAAEFEVRDRRNNYCSSKCKYAGAAKVLTAKHGVANPNQLPKAPEKRARIRAQNTESAIKMWSKPGQLERRNASNLKKYGQTCTFNMPHSVSKRFTTMFDSFGTRSARIISILKDLGIANYSEFCDRIIDRIETLGVNPYSQAFKAVLKTEFGITHEIIDDVLTFRGRGDLLRKFRSFGEVELLTFLQGLVSDPIEVNTRPAFMNSKELDIFIPSKAVAIEFHGLAFHSMRPIFPNPKTPGAIKKQHLDKYSSCKAAGVQLIQIFEDEWRERRGIVESMIKARLGVSGTTIFARKCDLRPVSLKEAHAFFEAHHISGSSRTAVNFGLYFKDELVACAALRKTWNKAYGENVLEIARFASKRDTSVVGGFQKLLKALREYCESQEVTTLLTYADCRFGSGKVYLKAGFSHLGHTGPNYFYERDGRREARFRHRRRKDEPGTEQIQNALRGWYQIYDAGSEIFILKISS